MHIKVKHRKIKYPNQIEPKIKLNKSSKNNDEEIFKQAEKEMQAEIKKFQSGTYHKSLRKTYGNGDLSPVKGKEAKKINYKWRKNITWDPDGPFASAWMRACAYGDLVKMKRCIEFPEIVASSKTVNQLIEERETLLNFSAILHVAKGATHVRTKWYNIKWALSGISMALLLLMYFFSYIGGYVTITLISPFINNLTHYIAHKPKHLDCMCELISMDCDVNAKDFAGCTALFYCVGENSNLKTLELAELLLMERTNINTRNRQGATPLRYAVLAGKVDSVQFLLENGADPNLVDNDGVSMNFTTDNAIREIFENFQKKKNAKVSLENKVMELKPKIRNDQSEKTSVSNLFCSYCKSTTKLSRCSSCFLTQYCGAECQRKDWEIHQEKCLNIRSQFKPFNATLNIFRQDKDIKKKETKKNFVVKISLAEGCDSSVWDNCIVKVYNKKKTLDTFIGISGTCCTEIITKIKDQGESAEHGFFYAFLDTDDKLHINTSQLQPEESW